MLARKLVPYLLLLIGLSCYPILAQDFRGTVAGRVTNPQRQGVNDAAVTVHSIQEGTDRTVRTDDNGHFQVPFLNPGTYDVIVEKDGFSKVRQTGLAVSTAQTTELDIALTLARVNQEVTVSAAPALIDTQSANGGLTIDSERVQNTPLQGQNIFAQAWSAPGVAVTSGVQRATPLRYQRIVGHVDQRRPGWRKRGTGGWNLNTLFGEHCSLCSSCFCNTGVSCANLCL